MNCFQQHSHTKKELGTVCSNVGNNSDIFNASQVETTSRASVLNSQASSLGFSVSKLTLHVKPQWVVFLMNHGTQVRTLNVLYFMAQTNINNPLPVV